MTFRKIFHAIAATSCLLIAPAIGSASLYPFIWVTAQETNIPSDIPSNLDSDTLRLSQYFEKLFDEMQKTSPEFATYVGATKHYNGKWTDHSDKAYALRKQITNEQLQQLHTINRENLTVLDKLNYDLLENDLKESLEGYKYQTHYMALDQLGGIPLDVESILMMMPRDSEADYQDLLSRLSGIPVLIEQTLDLLGKGLEIGMTPPRVVLSSLSGSIAKMIPSNPHESVFFVPFLDFSESIDAAAQEQLIFQATTIIEQQIYPSYAKLISYLETDYIPSCRTTIATGDLPNGIEYYKYRVRNHTTTDLSFLEIHEMGLQEVKRIYDEMFKILHKIEYTGSIKEYFTFLHTAPEFFYENPEDLLEGYRSITSYIDGQLPLLFGRFPKLPYEVMPVPDFLAEGQVGAYYMPGSLSTGRPGRFYANTHDLKTRPKWQMQSLALHEAVPGHHFQISLAQEFEGLPEFRKYNGYTAYIEGWGLYSEGLGTELGLYKLAEDQIGRLIEEVWRAVRLVVDTGIHAFGWTREDSIAYMMETTGMGEREVTTEIDRYIVWPGQALAYKIGELSMKRWRIEAQESLGAHFDVCAFHDMLLGQGALPLDICEKQVYAWIELERDKQ